MAFSVDALLRNALNAYGGYSRGRFAARQQRQDEERDAFDREARNRMLGLQTSQDTRAAAREGREAKLFEQDLGYRDAERAARLRALEGLATSREREPRAPAPRNIDPLSDEGIQAAARRANLIRRSAGDEKAPNRARWVAEEVRRVFAERERDQLDPSTTKPRYASYAEAKTEAERRYDLNWPSAAPPSASAPAEEPFGKGLEAGRSVLQRFPGEETPTAQPATASRAAGATKQGLPPQGDQGLEELNQRLTDILAAIDASGNTEEEKARLRDEAGRRYTEAKGQLGR